MPRHARLDAEGVLHHIIVRGIERRLIFRDNKDKKHFVERMGKIFTDTHTLCYAWALLGNHVHLLCKTGKVPLSTVMARLLTGHAVTFNKRYSRHGQLFQNRYKSILCQEDAYLTELVCYVHLNPLRAGIIKDLNDPYPYSGHSALMGKVSYPWQDVDYVLQYYGRTEKAARDAYLTAMTARLAIKRPDLTGGGLLRSYGSWGEVKRIGNMERIKGDERILGDSAFVEKVLSGEPRRITQPAMTLDALAAQVSNLYGITPESLQSGSRRSNLVEARSIFCFWAVRHGGYPAAKVAAFLNMTPPGVGYAVERGEAVVREKGCEL
ncbi:MAG: transposase [Syntrophus sp. (in: bacteria)]|nr:transposase [Syntrophus sp. (in: bacteria)]